jgi:RHS repeat-associated protein
VINKYAEYCIPAATNIGRFGYTGQAWLPELGLYYYKARIYSPTLGRFMQTDPLRYGDGINWYDYVGGDPVNFTDPSGLSSTIVVTAYRSGGWGLGADYHMMISRATPRLTSSVSGEGGRRSGDEIIVTGRRYSDQTAHFLSPILSELETLHASTKRYVDQRINQCKEGLNRAIGTTPDNRKEGDRRRTASRSRGAAARATAYGIIADIVIEVCSN